MRISGFSFIRRHGPLAVAHLPLRDLTVVLGANDTGKSRTLAALVSTLEHPASDDFEGIALVDLDVSEIEQVVRDALHGLEDVTAGTADTGRVAFDRWIEMLADGPHPPDAAMSDALRETRTFAFRRRESGWLINAVLPPHDRLHPRVAAAARDAEWSSPDLDPTGLEELATTSASVASSPWHVLAGMPIIAHEVGHLDATILPLPIVLPVESDDIVASAARAIASFVEVARFVDAVDADAAEQLHDGQRRGELAHRIARQAKTLSRQPVDVPGGFATVSPERDALTTSADSKIAAWIVQKAANAALPRFIADKYVLRLKPASVTAWPDRLLDSGLDTRNDNDYFASFSLDDAAEGFRLWTQLALTEGIDTLRLHEEELWETLFRLVHVLELLAEEHEWRADLAAHRAESEEENDPVDFVVESASETLTAYADAAIATIAELRVRLQSVRRDEAPLPAAREPMLGVSQLGRSERLFGERRWETLRPPLYLIDEPERHLHPRLQREAAAWLSELVRTRRSQAVVVTHAVPFLNARADASFLFFARDEYGRGEARPLDIAALTALSDVALELGFTRGELMANVRVLLFVEGRADQRVLEEVFGERIHAMGAVVVPISGAGRAFQVAETEVLLRFVSCPAAVLFDSTLREDVLEMQRDRTVLEEATRSKRTERKAIAQLLMTARQNGRDIEPLGIPVRDVFECLDADVLRERFPDFPGHAEAAAAFAERGAGMNMKAFLQQRYGVPRDLEVYEWAARRMRERDIEPPALVEVLDDAERLSLG